MPLQKLTQAELKAKRKARDAAYYAKNKERVCARAAVWRACNPERKRMADTAWSQLNPEKKKQHARAFAERSPARLKELQAEYRAKHRIAHQKATLRWQKENPDKSRVATARWKAKNRTTCALLEHNRKAQKRINGGCLSKDIVSHLYTAQEGYCLYCGQLLQENFQIDHKMPISLGGTNTDDNVQLLHAVCNQRKNNKHPHDLIFIYAKAQEVICRYRN